MLPLKCVTVLLRITTSAICKSTLLTVIGISERYFYPTWQEVSFIAKYQGENKFRFIQERSFSSAVDSVPDLENITGIWAWNLGVWDDYVNMPKNSYEIVKNECSEQKKTGETFSMTTISIRDSSSKIGTRFQL